jgi:hypothetical protein
MGAGNGRYRDGLHTKDMIEARKTYRLLKRLTAEIL